MYTFTDDYYPCCLLCLSYNRDADTKEICQSCDDKLDLDDYYHNTYN